MAGKMDPAEVEFLAEKEEIGIVPNFSQDQIHLIGVRLHRLALYLPLGDKWGFSCQS